MQRTEWILLTILIVLVALIGAVLIMSGLRLPRSQAQTPQTVALPQALTARSAYDMALPLAQQWASDATLVNAQATWDVSPDFHYSEASWGFIFYSNSQSATAMVSVTDDRAGLLATRQSARQLVPADLSGWQIDSPQIVETVLNTGGQPFLNRLGDATLVLTLDASNKPVWKGKLFHEESGETLSVEVDPASGDVLEVEQTQ